MVMCMCVCSQHSVKSTLGAISVSFRETVTFRTNVVLYLCILFFNTIDLGVPKPFWGAYAELPRCAIATPDHYFVVVAPIFVILYNPHIFFL